MSPDHLNAAELAAYLSPGPRAPQFERIQAHLADCAECRQEAIQIISLVRAESRRRAARWGGVGLAAAVGLMALGVWPFGSTPMATTPITRGPMPGSTVAATGIVALAPLGEVRSAVGQVGFAWRPVNRAVEYRLTLSDAGGGTLWSRSTTDTTLVLPLEVSLAPGAPYYWYIDALLGDGGSVTSGAQEFHTRR